MVPLAVRVGLGSANSAARFGTGFHLMPTNVLYYLIVIFFSPSSK